MFVRRLLSFPAIVATLLLVACSPTSKPNVTPVTPLGDYRADLLAGGGASLTSQRAEERLFQVGRHGQIPAPDIDFAVATDGALWASVGSPDTDYSGTGTLGHGTALARVDQDGSVSDISFGFLDPAGLEEGSASDRAVILSGPVSDGAGGVVVVVAPEPQIEMWTELPWSRLYRVDSEGNIMLLEVPEGFEPTGVGPSRAGGFIAQVVSYEYSCSQFMRSGDDGVWTPFFGAQCGPDVGAVPTMSEVAEAPIEPLGVYVAERNPMWIRVGALPDGRAVVVDSWNGLYVEDRSGRMIALTASSSANLDWSDRTAQKPFESFGIVGDIQPARARFSLSPNGEMALLISPRSTPETIVREFQFDLGQVPANSTAQAAANLWMSDSSAPTPSNPDLGRGEGIAFLDLMGDGDLSARSVSLVSTYGDLCDWNGPDELVCAINGWSEESPDSPGGAPSAVFVAVPVPVSAQ